jgi:chemotaxis family two-component system response regulator Rcp1
MDRSVEVLLVEDDPTDVEITLEALDGSRFPTHVEVMADGRRAIDYLSDGAGQGGDRRPDLVLLDLKLPEVSGHEVLAFIKGQAHLKSIPVVVISSSTDESDVRRSYGQHANCYVAKPVELDAFIQVVRSVMEFWFGVAELPTNT